MQLPNQIYERTSCFHYLNYTATIATGCCINYEAPFYVESFISHFNLVPYKLTYAMYVLPRE
jgi:hypothetical protein